MAALQPAPMSFADYLRWEAAQSEKHELVDGYPLPRRLRMMTGGTGRHSVLAMRIGAALFARLPKGCLPYASDLKVVSPTGNARYPDVTVDCSPKTLGQLYAEAPQVVFEVLSPSNTVLEQTRAFHDYQSIPSLSAIVFLSQDAPFAQVWRREGASWRAEQVDGIEERIVLPSLDLTLALAELYEGLDWPAADQA